MRNTTVLLLGIFLAACGGAPALTPAGQNVKVQKSDPADGCTEVGFVSAFGSNFKGSAMHEVARNKIRNEAAEKGANYLRLESIIEDGNGVEYTGTAFDCPKE